MSTISYAIIEIGDQEITICLFDPAYVCVGMRYLLMTEKIVDMALRFFYKGEHFADEFDDVLIPTFGPLSANWTIEDYGQTDC